jgi:NAD(P)-dependent dehydrogenase (short-subunit alcohol dehydrogenase family)
MDMPDFSLNNEVALVTGGRRGIGKAIALALAGAGADVAICDNVIEDGELSNTAEQIKKLGRRSLAFHADTTIKTDIESMVGRVIEQFGKIDILINNAGILIKAPILEFSEKDWDSLFNVDLKGYFLCSQAVGKHMVANKKGNIINIATQWAFKTNPGMGVYGIAKSGVIMLTRVLARELGPYNIRANAIAPGMVKTEFSRSTWTNSELLNSVESALPLKRAGEVDDVTGAAVYLASKASGYVTGHTIIVDGGGLA